ncbi:MAG: DUF1802 family protein [Cyanobacteria bacterium J06621_8]
MLLTNQLLQHALKEWAIAVEALSKGETIVLLRKGGIREAGFSVKHSPIWLYPTYEHQKPELLKPSYESQVVPVPSGWHPESVTIQSCAEITDVLSLDDSSQVKALQPYHVWHELMISDRLKWQPKRPLFVLLLRVYRCATPQTIPFEQAYGGCKSWINLRKPIATDNLQPVLSAAEYQQLVGEIKTVSQNS